MTLFEELMNRKVEGNIKSNIEILCELIEERYGCQTEPILDEIASSFAISKREDETDDEYKSRIKDKQCNTPLK